MALAFGFYYWLAPLEFTVCFGLLVALLLTISALVGSAFNSDCLDFEMEDRKIKPLDRHCR